MDSGRGRVERNQPRREWRVIGVTSGARVGNAARARLLGRRSFRTVDSGRVDTLGRHAVYAVGARLEGNDLGLSR